MRGASPAAGRGAASSTCCGAQALPRAQHARWHRSAPSICAHYREKRQQNKGYKGGGHRVSHEVLGKNRERGESTIETNGNEPAPVSAQNALRACVRGLASDVQMVWNHARHKSAACHNTLVICYRSSARRAQTHTPKRCLGRASGDGGCTCVYSVGRLDRKFGYMFPASEGS